MIDGKKRRGEREDAKRKIAAAEKYRSKAVGDAVIGLAASGGGALLGAGIDAFTGEAGTFNSGELPQNVLSSGLLLGTGAAAGMATASALDSPRFKQRDTSFDQEKRKPRKDRQLGKELGSTDQYNRFASQYRKDRKGGMSKDDAIGAETARQSTRNLRGAAIGAAAMLVPTLLGMRDQEKLANQSASLM